MLSNFHFHHIGYAVVSIEKTMYYYIDGGYSCSSVIFDPIQNVNICFLTKEGEPMIELLEPVDEILQSIKILRRMEFVRIIAVIV
ncbi:MAG: VOC family protein [Bacteroides uniformis]